MTDIEINRALALAIGWTEDQMLVDVLSGGQRILNIRYPAGGLWRVFDYTDWRVIGPIAQRYNCFPTRFGLAQMWWPPQVVRGRDIGAIMFDTPQKAIAMAVIERAKL